MKTIKVGSVVADSPGRHEGTLTTGYLPDGAPVDIPVIVVRGKDDGPVLWIHACVHGDEYCGTFSTHAFVNSLDPEKLKGAVVALPILNITAFRSRQRTSPFEGYNNRDLNRCFPGNPEGGFTEQVAAAIWRELKNNATHLVDFHTALTATTRWALYADLGGEVSKVGRQMAEAFGYEHVLPTPAGTLGGSAMMEAAAQGIPSYIIEAGGLGPAFTRETVEDVAERLRNLSRAIGLLDGPVTQYGPLTLFSNFEWVTAPRGGLFRARVKCGERIAKGDVVGTYIDPFGDDAGDVTAPAGGVVLAHHPGPIIPQGDVLIHIGLNPKQA